VALRDTRTSDALLAYRRTPSQSGPLNKSSRAHKGFGILKANGQKIVDP
jgi:hypothetical protein